MSISKLSDLDIAYIASKLNEIDLNNFSQSSKRFVGKYEPETYILL